ncbi:hypothetical protein GF337_12140, partial [candidate division KSB1 bacterium]|nr:hypothetical protein [candidate division KSB1 bacterium]
MQLNFPIKKELHMKKSISFSMIAVILLLSMCNQSETEKRAQGLIGAYYGNADLTRIKQAEILTDLDRYWDEETGHGSAWSGKYEGFVIAPVSGEVNFHLETNKRAILKIDQNTAEAQGENSSAKTTVVMKKGAPYPISISYFHPTREPGFLRVMWSRDGQEQKPIPPDNLFFTEEIARNWNYIIEPDPKSVDRSQFITVPTKNVVVYYEPGRFCGWPANNGIWSWGDEIVVGFTLSYYQEKELHHSKDETRPSLTVLARSNDGGETWSLEDPENYVDDGGEPVKNETPIHFKHPDFALRCLQNRYFYSYDRCRTWNGPYLFPDFGEEKLTSRTDYVVNSDKECLFFFSAEEERVQARLQDQAFCARTTDGGLSYEFLSWIAQPIEVRAVMPSTVRIAENHLVSALRRRHDKREFDDKPPVVKNWIDVYESEDDGETWQFLSEVAQTDLGKRNGNPPSLVKLSDGRLC